MHQNHGFHRIYIQRPMLKNKHFPDNLAQKPPKRLFGAIMGRLKIEKVLKILKGKFSIFLAILAISIILSAVALSAFRSELMESESVSLFSLLFSDTKIILSQFKYFAFAVLESMPVISILISFTALTLFMFALKFVVEYYEKISKLTQLIKK